MSWGSWGLHEAAQEDDVPMWARAVPIPSGAFGDEPLPEPVMIKRIKHQPPVEHPDGPDGMWHGTPSGDLRGSYYGLHVGTYPAAAEALEAKIGKPLDGKPWDGTRRYGDTPVNMQVRGSFDTTQGLPNGTAVYSNGQPVSLDSYPTILPVRIVGPMSNTPDDFYEDWPTNRLMTRQLKRTRDPRTSLGHYYWNEAEDDSVSAVVPHADHLEVLDPNWPGHRTASTDGIRYAHIVEAAADVDVLADIAKKRTRMRRGSHRTAMPARKLPIILHRGLRGIRFPHKIMDMINSGHPGAADAVLDYLNSADNPHKEHPAEGLGIHWTPNTSVAHSFGGNYVNSEPHGVWMRAEWDGKGRRRIPKEDVIPSEHETQLHPGTPLTVTELGLSMAGGYVDPDIGEWRRYPNNWQYFPVNREFRAGVEKDAMGKRGPLPENLTFKYWPEEANGTAGHAEVGHPDLPAVTAHIGDDPKPVGYLSWIPGHPDDYRREILEFSADPGETLADFGLSDFGQPIGSGPNDRDYIGWPTTIGNVGVNDEWQRHGIADAMFDHVQQNYLPELRHSYDLSPDGYAWSRKEEKRRKKRRTAAPAEDPFDAHRRRAAAAILHLHHYLTTGEHPGGFGPTIAIHPQAHHPELTNFWAAEVMHPESLGGPFGDRVQHSTNDYVHALTGVADEKAKPSALDDLEGARNKLRVDLQHGGHFQVPDLREFSRLPGQSDALKLPAVNPRLFYGMEGPNEAHKAGYQINCQRCCLALDARHRGLNVEARPNYWDPDHDPLNSDEQWTDDYLASLWRDQHGGHSRWIDADDQFQLTRPSPAHWDQMHDHIASWGPGARALVAMTQRDPTKQPGADDELFRHVIMAHVGSGGNVRFIDPQSADVDASGWRDRVMYGYYPKGVFKPEHRAKAEREIEGMGGGDADKLMARNFLYSPLRYMRIDDKRLSQEAAQHLVDRGTAGPSPIIPGGYRTPPKPEPPSAGSVFL